MNAKKNDAPETPQSFEHAMRRLETIVDDMESGNLSLEQMITAFEEGRTLSIYCGDQLTAIEKRIEMLVKAPDGETIAEPFTKRQAPADGE